MCHAPPFCWWQHPVNGDEQSLNPAPYQNIMMRIQLWLTKENVLIYCTLIYSRPHSFLIKNVIVYVKKGTLQIKTWLTGRYQNTAKRSEQLLLKALPINPFLVHCHFCFIDDRSSHLQIRQFIPLRWLTSNKTPFNSPSTQYLIFGAGTWITAAASERAHGHWFLRQPGPPDNISPKSSVNMCWNNTIIIPYRFGAVIT